MDENTNQQSTTPLGNERSLAPGQDNIASNNLPTLPNIDENTPLNDITKQYTDIGTAYTGLVENAADNVGDRQVQLVGNDFGATNPYMFNTYYEPASTSFASEMRKQGTQRAVEVGLERAEEEAKKNAEAAQKRYNNAVAAVKQRQQEAAAAKAHISETDLSKMPQGTNERELLNSEAFKKMNDKERKDALTSVRTLNLQKDLDSKGAGVKDWNIKEERGVATSKTKTRFPELFANWDKKTQAEKDAVWARKDVGNYWTEQYMIEDFKRRGGGELMVESFNDIHNDVRAIVKAVKDSTVSKLDQHVFETLAPIASAPDVKDWKFDNIKKSIENSDLDQARKDEYIAAMNSIGKDQFERLWKGYTNKDLEIGDDGMLKHAGSTIGYNGLNGNNNPKYTYNGKSESIGFAIKAIYNSFAGNVENIENMSAPDWMGSVNYIDNFSFTSPQTGLSVDQMADELFTDAFGADWSSISALAKLQEEHPDDFNYLLNQSSYILASGGAPFDVVDDPNKKYYIDGKYWSVNDENSPLKMGDLVFYSVDLPKNDKGEYADEDLNRFIELYSDIYTGKKEATDENKEALNKYYSSYQTSLAAAMAASARYGTKVDENIYSAVLSMRDGADLSKLNIVNPSKPEETISLDDLKAWFNSFNEDAQYNGYAALVNRTRGLKGRYYIYDDKMNGVTSVTERQNGVNTIGKYGKTSGSDNMEMANQVANLSDDQCLALNLFLDSQMKSGKIKTNFFDNDEVSLGDSLANQMLNSARGTATMIGAAGTFMWGFLTGQDKVISDAGKIWDEMTTLDQFDNMSWAGNSSRTDATLFNNYTEDVRKMQRSNLNHLIDTTFNIDYFDPNNTYDEATGEVKNSKGEVISYTDNSYFHKDDWKGFTDTMAGMAGFIAEATMEYFATAGIGNMIHAGKLALDGTTAGVKLSQAKNALANYLTSAPTIGSIKQAHRLNQANAFVRKASEVLGSPTMTNYLINNIDDLSKVTEGLAKQAAIASGKTAAKEAAGNVAKEAVASFSDDAVKLGEKATQTIGNSADNVLGEGAKTLAESADNFTDDMLKSYLDNVATGEEKAAAQNTLDTLTQYKNLSDALAPGLEEAAKTYKTQFAIDRMYMSIADDVDYVARTAAQKLSKYISSQIDNLNFGKMLGRGASGVIDDITYDGIKRAAVNVSLSEATGISVKRIMSLEDDTARLLYDVMQSTRGSNKLVTNDITKYISSRNLYSLSDDVSKGTIDFKKAAEQLVSASETAQRANKALSIDDALRIMARNSSEKGKLISTLRRSEFWRDRIADYSRDIMQGYYNPHLDEHFNSDYTSIEEYVTDPTQWLWGSVFDFGMSGVRKAISSVKLSSVNRKLDKLVSEIDLSKGVDNDSALLAKNLRKMNSLKLEADRLTNKVFDGGISYNKVHSATTNIEKQINTKLDEITNHFDLTKSLDFMNENIAQAAKDSTALDRLKAFTGFGQTKVMSAAEVNRMLIRSDDTLKSFIYANDALKAKFTARFADMVNSCPNVKKLTSKQYKDALINAWDNTIGTTDFAKQFGAKSLVKRKDGKYTNTINISDKAKAKELFTRGQEIVWNAFYDELAKYKSQLAGVVDFRSLKTELNGLRDRIVEVGYEMIDNGQPVRWNYFPIQGLMFEGAKDTPVALTGFYYGAGEHTSLMSNIADPTRQRDTMDMSQIVSDIKSGKTEYQRELSFNEKLRAKNRGEPEVEFKSVPYNEDGFNPLYAVTAYLNAYDSKKFAAPYLDPMRNGNIVIADDGILNIRMGNETAAKSIEAAKYYNNLKEGYSKSASAKMTYSNVENSIKDAKDIILGKDSKEIAKNRAKINSQKTKLRKTISNSDQFKSIANYMDINNPTDAQIAERLQSRFSTMTSDIKAVASGAKDKLSDLYNNSNSVQYRSVIDGLAKNKTALKDLNQLDGRTIDFGDVDLNYNVFNKRYYGVIGIMESTQRAIDNINASKKLSPELTLGELEFMSRQNALLNQMDNVNTTKVINESANASTFEASTAGHKEFSALNAKFAAGTKIMGIDISGKTIEDVYQNTLKGSGKNKAPAADSILGKATADAEKKAGRALTKIEKETISQRYYDQLWDVWGKQNPELKAQIENLPAGTKITDRFAKTGVSQANSLQRWVRPAQEQADLATIKFGANNELDGKIKSQRTKVARLQEEVDRLKAKKANPVDVDTPWSGKKMLWEEGTAKAREFISESSPIDLSNEYGTKDSLAMWLKEGTEESLRNGEYIPNGGDEGVLKRWNSIPEEVRNKISEDPNFARLWEHYSPAGVMSHLYIDFVYLPDTIDRIYADYLWGSSKGTGGVNDALRKAEDALANDKKILSDLEAQVKVARSAQTRPAQKQADLATIKFSHLDDKRPDELRVVLMDDSKTVNKAKSTDGNILHTMARNKGDGTIEFHPKEFMKHYENVKSGKSGWNMSDIKEAKDVVAEVSKSPENMLTWTLLHERGHDAPGGNGAGRKYSGEGGKEAIANNWAYEKFFDKTSPDYVAAHDAAVKILGNMNPTTTISAPRYSVEDFVKIREIDEVSKADITSTIYNMMLNKYGDKEFKGTKTFSSSNIKKTINQFAYDAYDAIALDKVSGEGITLAEVVERFNDTFPNAELFFEKGNLESYNTLSSKISSYQNAGGDLNTLKQDIADTLRRVNDGEIKLTPEQTRRLAAAYYDLDEASFSSERITNRGRSELSIDNKVDDEGATFESTIASSADYAEDPAKVMAENADTTPTREGLNISIDVNEDRSAIGKINNLNYVMDLMARRKTDYKTRITANKKTWGVFNDVIKPNYESVVNGINAQLPKGKKLNIAKVVDNSSKMSDSNWLRITKQFDNGVESFSIGNKIYSRQEVAEMIKNGIDGRGAIKSMDPDKLRKYIADNKLKITEPMATALATLDKTYKDFAEDFLDATNRRTVSGTLVSPKDAINNILSSSLDVNNRPLNFDASLLASVSDAPYSSTRANSAMKFPDADGGVAEVNIVYDYGTGSEGTTGTASYWYEKTTADGDVIRYDSEEELAASLAPNVSADDIRFAMNDAGYDLNIGEKMEPVTDWFYHGDRSTRRGIDNVGPDYEDWQIDNANVGSAKMSNKTSSSDARRINAEIKKLGDVTPLTAEEERMYKQIISSKFPYDNLSAEYKDVYDKAKKIEKYNRLLAAKRASASNAISAGTNPMLDFVESTYAYNNTKSSIEIENALYGKDGKPGYIDTVNNLTRDNARMKLKRDSDYYEATADIIAGLREMDGSPEMKASIISALENVKSDFRKSNAGDISDDIDKLIDETIYQLDKKYANKDELVDELIQNNPTYKAMMENIEAGKNMKRGAGQTIISIDNNGPIIVNSDADVSGKISIKQLRESRELVAMKKDKKPVIDDIANRHKDKKILKSMRDGFTDGYSKKQLVGEATMNRQNKWIDNLVEAIKEKTGAVEIDESKVYINKTVASLGQSFFGEGTAGWQERAYKLATSLSEFNKLMQDIHLAGGVGQYNAFTLRNALTMLWQDPIGGTKALFTNFRNARDNDSVIKFFINNSEKLLKYAMDSGDFSTINKFAPMFTMRDETIGKGFFTSAIESIMDIPSTIAESESKLAGFGKAMSNVYAEMFNNPTFARWTLIADADLRMRNYDKAKKYVNRIARSFNLTDEDFETMDGGIWQSKDTYIANLARLRTEMYWRPQDFVKSKFNAKKFLAVEEAANNKRTVEALRSMPKKTTAADAFRNFFFAMNYKLQMNMHPVHGFGSVAASIYNVPRVNMQLASKQSLNLAASRFAGGGNRNEAITLIGIAALAHAWNTYIGAPSAWSQLWDDDERAKQGKFSGIAKSLQNFQDFFKVWLPDQKTGKFNPQQANSLDPAFSIFTLQNSGARALNALINPNAAHISPQRNDFGLQNAQIGDWKFGRGIEGAMDEFVGANLLAGYKAAYEVLNNNTYFGNNIWEQPYLPDGSENPNYDPGRSFMASIAHILNLDGAIEGNGLTGAGSNRWVKGLDIDSIYWENGQQLDTPKTKGLKIGKKGKWQDKTGTVSGSGLIQHEYTTAIAAINDGDYFEALSGAMELPFKSRSYTSRARTSLNQEVSMALRDAKKEYEQSIEGASVEEKDKAFAKFASKAVEIVHDWSHEYGDVLGKNDELTATATKMLMAFMSDEYDDDLMYMQNMYVKLKQELRMADGDQFIFSKKAAEEAIAAGMSPEEAAEKWNKHLTALKEAQMKEYKARLALEEAGINDGLDTSVFDSTDFMYDKLSAEDATISKKIYTEIKGKLESQVGEFKNFKEMKSYYEGLIDEASSTKQKAKLAEKYNDYVTDVISPYVEKYGGAVFNNAYWDGDNISNHFGKYIIIPADQYYRGKSPRANYLKNKLGIGWANAKHPEYNENLPSDKEVKESLNDVAKALAKGQMSSAKALVDNALLQLRKGYVHAAPVDYDKLIRMRALLSSRSK